MIMRSERSAEDCMMPAVRHPTAFVATQWNLVRRAGETDSIAGQIALEKLCRIYWPPLYAFARRHGLASCDAEDLTQGFFADLIARGAVAHANAARGRFRTFLLASFQNYASHQRAHDGSRKRGGGCTILSLEAIVKAEGCFLADPAMTVAPGARFDREWAMSLLGEALAAVRDEYRSAGKATLFGALEGALWDGRGEIDYSEMAARLGMTEGAVKVAMCRLRHRFRAELRAEVAKTVENPAEIDGEIRHLLAAFEAAPMPA